MRGVFLPQNDPDPRARAEALADAQVAWAYGDWKGQETFARVTPARELPRLDWLVRIIPSLFRVTANHLLVVLVRSLSGRSWTEYAPRTRPAKPNGPPLSGVPEAPKSAAKAGPVARLHRKISLWVFTRIARSLEQTLGDYGTTADPSAAVVTPPPPPRARPGVSIADFIEIFRAYSPPAVVTDWKAKGGLSDALFAWLRVAGPASELVQRIVTLPPPFPMSLRAFDQDPVANVAAEGRLFLVDYADLAVLVDSAWHGLPRYVTTPKALFVVRDGTLTPAAIQCEAAGAVYQPGDPEWELAKHVVQVADGNHHELVLHLGRTHLLVEVFLMATRRHLAPNHPLSRLLLPHFEGTVFINGLARSCLIAPGGAVDRIFAGRIDTAQNLAIASLTTLDLATYDLPTRTVARGTSAITMYPWRDDAQRIWDVLEKFVGGVVALAYPDPAALAGDTELAAWSATLSQPVGHGGLPGFAAPRRLPELTRILTLIIFTASAQHAAVNFPQYPLMSFVALLAGSGFALPPGSGRPLPKLIDFLPPRQLALQQADMMYLLSSVHDTQLGHYDAGWFEDPEVLALVSTLKQSLRDVEEAIHRANLARPHPYTQLLPSLIPQSTSI
jgi:arachidonate 15-lipoxygenase